ncbi:MAG: CTP synthetase [Rhodobacteraceae bacterium]|nr:CTP synthetase [Paracoccaceae bacterium]
MHHLSVTIYMLLAPTMAGVFVVVALVMGYAALSSLLIAAGIGAVTAIAASWALAHILGRL